MTAGAPDPRHRTKVAQSGLPRYVEYGGRATSPGPFRCQGGRFRALIIEGEHERLASLVRRTLTEPAEGSVEYRPLGRHLMLMVGHFESVTSQTAPFDRWGAVQEACASIFVPVLAGHDRGSSFVAERLCIAAPYVLVDNPMSYLGGREDYGYPKTMARFEPENAQAPRVRVAAFGGDFNPEHTAGWRPLLEIAPVDADASDEAEPDREGPAEFVSYLAGAPRGNGDEPVVPSLDLAADLLKDVLTGRGMQVFLKQFRDVADGGDACFQSVVEAPVQMERVSVRPLRRDWAVTIHPLDSHPIAEDLGVSSQVASRAFDLDMDFVLEDGVEIHRTAGTQADRPAAPTDRASRSGDPIGRAFALVEAAARYGYRGLSDLRAARPALTRPAIRVVPVRAMCPALRMVGRPAPTESETLVRLDCQVHPRQRRRFRRPFRCPERRRLRGQHCAEELGCLQVDQERPGQEGRSRAGLGERGQGRG